MINLDELGSSIWEMANNLRGNMDAGEYKNYIFGFLFYRFLSEKEEKYLLDQHLVVPGEGEAFHRAFARAVEEDGWEDFEEDLVQSLGYAIKPKFIWSAVCSSIGNSEFAPSNFQDMFDAFNQAALKNENAESDFRGIFDDVSIGNARLGNNTASRAKSLVGVVKLVEKIECVGEDGQDVLGRIYEYLIKQFAASAGKKGGEFYTPHEVSLLMAKIVTEGKTVDGGSFSVFDPACGSGSLLLTVGAVLGGAKKIGAVKYYGQELNTSTYNIARMNLMMHDVVYQDMHLNNADTLGRDWPDGPDAKGIDHPRMFDAVVENPPYSQKWDPDESLLKDARYKEYGRLAPKTKADFAFLLNGLYHLDQKNGVMAIVLPHGVLFRGAAEEEIRRTLIKKNYIDTIIGLPANLFYGTAIPTIIMVLKKDQKKDKNILFIDASKDFDKVKNQNVLTAANIEKIFKAYCDREDIEKYAHLASPEEIEQNDYNLNIPRYVDTTEEEEEIDLDAILAKLQQDEAEIEKAQKEIDEQLKILGVIK